MGRRSVFGQTTDPLVEWGEAGGSGLGEVSSVVVWVWEAGVPEREGAQSPQVLRGWWSPGGLGSWQACSSSVHWLPAWCSRPAGSRSRRGGRQQLLPVGSGCWAPALLGAAVGISFLRLALRGNKRFLSLSQLFPGGRLAAGFGEQPVRVAGGGC